ncbi:MAG TPA: selenocysteine-specific translation elongation factor [Candidatus Aphodovivens avistercoris]|nr:selenocysteine-specific translation elongation factor [Candidatus Aphodovivens avistercoris]
MNAQPSLVLGTAGHIDHGKSSLIRALTGTDPDRLAEEKRRGITIELGFAQLQLPDGRTMGVVDVPGHERFVRQMIAGSTGIDVALLCIAADDGVMPQTEEHLRVLELLGVQRMVVALTKADLVDAEWAEFMADEVRARLAATPYADAPVVAVSAKEGTGLDELKRALAAAADGAQRVHGGAAARLPIDRSFTIKGAGTVVTGTLWSGTVAPGDELELLPAGGRVRVRSVQEHGAAVEAAQAGNRTAVNLAGVGTDEARPGMMLAALGAVHPCDRFDAWITYLAAPGDAAPLESGVTARIAHGTAEVPGRVLLMGGRAELEAGTSALAQIRLDQPLPVARGDRFIVRTVTPVAVVGGGQVLLCAPRRRTALAPAEQELLAALRDGRDDDAVDAALSLQGAPASAADIARACGVEADACAARLDALAAAGKVEKLAAGGAPFYAAPAVLRAHESAVENALMKFHAANPAKTGAGKAELARLAGKRIAPEAFDAVLEQLRGAGRVVVDGGEVSHPKAGAGARRQEEQAAAALKEALDASGLTPPAIGALSKELGLDASLAHRALGALERQGAAARVGDYYFSAAALDKARAVVEAHLQQHGPSSAADLKDALGVSRKHAIPLLEHFDARGLTRRTGDLRELNR